jgi:hypothetical protein
MTFHPTTVNGWIDPLLAAECVWLDCLTLLRRKKFDQPTHAKGRYTVFWPPRSRKTSFAA